MLELLYPIRPAKVIPSPRSYMADNLGGEPQEMLPIVEESGVVVAQSPRSYVHGGSKLLHPVVHLHIINRFGDICLQKRSMSKDLLPGYWDTAVGGHVSYGEQIEEALYREAAEELAFYEFNPQFLRSYVHESETERELVCVFAAVGNFEISVDNSEVDAARFWSVREIGQSLGKGILTPNFESEFELFRDQLLSLL